jgi:transcriptional regulator of acetoin/glycerol metabolism
MSSVVFCVVGLVTGSDYPDELAAEEIIIEIFNLEAAERRLCVEALTLAGNIVGAAQILGITRHALKRRIIKLGIEWNRTGAPMIAPASSPAMMPSL